MQHCYGTVRFIIYNTDSNSSTVKSAFKSSVTALRHSLHMSQSISFCKQEGQLLPRDHAMRNVNPNHNPHRNPNPVDPNCTKRNPNVNQLCIYTESNLMTV